MLSILKKICFVEGVSCIGLFFVAMPVKYLLLEPRLVSVVGMIHGILWILMVAAAVITNKEKEIDSKNMFLIMLVSTLPFGMFWVDKRIGYLEKQ